MEATTKGREATHAYVGIHTCGRMYAAHVIRPEYAKDLAEFAADIVRSGYELAKKPIPEVQQAEWCPCFNDNHKRAQEASEQVLLDLAPPTPREQP